MRRLLPPVLLAAVAAAAAIVLIWGPTYARGLSFVIRAARVEGPLYDAARHRVQRVVIDPVQPLPTRHGPIRSRVYRPEGDIARTVVVVPGVNAMGVDEPRLKFLSGELAASGIAVATIELPDLMRFTFAPRAVDMIEDAALSVSGRRDLAPDGAVGLMGVSFAGGLSVVAAGRPALRDRLAFVFSFGGHGDLPRALRYLCTGVEPLGPDEEQDAQPRRRSPHDYGLAVVLLNAADRMVPAEQAAPLRQGILTFLRASHLDVIAKDEAGPVFAQARSMAAALPEPAASLLELVNERDAETLGRHLLPVLEATAFAPELSPERSALPSAPVYLLHGRDDAVIPAVETRLLAHHLEGRAPVECLLTDLITHAEADRPPGIVEAWKLVGFFGRLLDE